MLKSERDKKSEKRQKQTRLRELFNVDKRFCGLVCLHIRRIGGGAFISQRFTLERSFCTCEKQTKRKLFTVFCGIRFVWVNYR